MRTETNTWEEVDFRKAVFNMVSTDERFDGMSAYLSGVRICWSYTTASSVSGHGFIFMNPDWWDLLPDETRKSVIFHHGLALLAKHAQRRKGLNTFISSMASQYVINLVLQAEGFTNEGWDWLIDEQFRGWSVESVYAHLIQDLDLEIPSEVIQEITQDMLEELIEAILEDDDDDMDLDDQIALDDENVIRTIEEGPSFGIGLATGSGGFDLNIGMGQEIIKGATYEEILAPYMETGEPTMVRSYRRPSRRSSNSSEFILPGRVKKKGDAPERIQHLYLLLDVSGSIGEKQARQFNYSAQTIKKIIDPEMMTVMFFDTEIKLERTFTADQKYTPLKVRAGGGTALGPAYKRIAEIDPELVMIFTDLQVGIPPQPTWDTIWLVPEMNCTVPSNLYGPVYLIPERERP